MGEHLTEAEKREQRYQEYLQRLREFRLIDDEFMTECFDGSIPCTELLLRIVLQKPDLAVRTVRTQAHIGNLLHRTVTLDVEASDSAGNGYDIEIQRESSGAGRKRARFHSSMLDTKMAAKGTDFDSLPDSYVIFITEDDVVGGGRAVYSADRFFAETGEPFCDGSHILYVNGAYRDDSPIGNLMHDFFCQNPDDMHYPVLADRVRYFKENQKGVSHMCRSMEELYNKGRLDGKQEGIQEGMLKGMLEGILKGKQEGIQEGMLKGMLKGKQEGIQEGKLEGIQEGKQEGMLKGKQEGKQEEKVEVALRLLQFNQLTLEQIADLTQLPLAGVKRLQAGQAAEPHNGGKEI